MPTSLPFVRPARDDSASTARIADLIRHRGAQRADAVARSGAIAGQMWSDVGRTASGLITDLLRMRETQAADQAAQRERDRAYQVDEVVRLTPRDPQTGRLDPERIAQEVSHIDPEKALTWWARADEQTKAQLAADRQRVEQVAKAAGSLLIDLEQTPASEQQPKWTAARTAAIEGGLLQTPDEMPETVDLSWLRQTFDQARTVSDLARELETIGQQQAPKTRQVEITNPDGSKTIRIVADEAGQEFTSAAPPGATGRPGTFEGLIDAMATERGRPLSVEEVLQARSRWTDAGRSRAPDGTPALSQAQKAAAERWKQSELRQAERVFRETTKDLDRSFPKDDAAYRSAVASLEDTKERIQLSYLEQVGATDTGLPPRGETTPRRAGGPPPGAPGSRDTAPPMGRTTATGAPPGAPRPMASHGGAAPPAAGADGGPVTLKLPDGTFASFPSHQALDAFLKAAGLTLRQ